VRGALGIDVQVDHHGEQQRGELESEVVEEQAAQDAHGSLRLKDGAHR